MPQPDPDSAARATDKAYWSAVRGLYSVMPDVVNLENGYWGIMAEPVRREFIRQSDMVKFLLRAVNRLSNLTPRQFWTPIPRLRGAILAGRMTYVRQRSRADFEAVRVKGGGG